MPTPTATIFVPYSALAAVPPAAHHATHEPGGTDALVALDAAVVTSGTLANARLATNVTIAGDYTEKGRTTPMGHWIAVPFNAANFTANSGAWTVAAANAATYSYMLVGKTGTLALYLVNTTVTGAPTQLLIALPGIVFALTQAVPIHYLAGGVDGTGIGYVQPGTSQLVIVRDMTQPAWAAGPTHVIGTLALALQ